MKTIDYNALATSAPINRDAALARDGRSKDRYESKKKILGAHWSAPPPLPIRPSAAPDLTGHTFGKFTVIGYIRTGKKGSMWLVRCLCGDYEERSGRAVKNPENKFDRCGNCQQLLFLRREQHYLRTGKDVTFAELEGRKR